MAALISVVNRDPNLIVDMLCELDDATVAVRFFAYDKASNKFVPDWVHVDRRLVLRGGHAIYAGAENALWPAVIEKAFAARAARASGGGLEVIGQGGKCSSVFSMLLGRQASEIEIANPTKLPTELSTDLHGLPPNPLTMNAEQLIWYCEVAKEPAKAFANAAEAAYTQLAQSPGGGEDRTSVLAAVVKLAKETHISANSLERMREYIRMHIPDLGAWDGKYSTRALMLHGTIDMHLRKGEVIALASKSWSSERRGPSGEPLSDLGLAGNHAYAVIAAHQLDGRLMLTIRNPWGHTGMGYRRLPTLPGVATVGDLLSIPVLKRFEINSPQFDIDVEDVIRFFGQLYVC
jgi:hypothetical protein